MHSQNFWKYRSSYKIWISFEMSKTIILYAVFKFWYSKIYLIISLFKYRTLLWYFKIFIYYSIIFDSCIFSISSYSWTNIFSWSSSPVQTIQICFSYKVLQEEQLYFQIVNLENCKRNSKETNWNSKQLQEHSR